LRTVWSANLPVSITHVTDALNLAKQKKEDIYINLCAHHFSCKSSRECIADYKQCDGSRDCGDGTDEDRCDGKSPLLYMLQ
jgi:Low-density lipoprotein receptor domain class A